MSISVMLLSGLCNVATAQETAPVRGNFEMVSSAKADAVKTSFSVSTAGNDNLVLQLVPDQPFRLNARIVNKNGKVMSTIPAEDVGIRYAQNIDIRTLPPGEYFIEIAYGDKGEKNYRIPFSK